MNALLRMFENAVVDQLVGNGPPLTGHSKGVSALGIFSLALLGTGAVFVVYGAYLWLDARYAPDTAAFLTGIFCLVLSGLCAAAIAVMGHLRRRHIRDMKGEIVALITEIVDVVGDEASEPARENPKTAVLLSSAAGYVAGKRFL